jgi:hypothetical protein
VGLGRKETIQIRVYVWAPILKQNDEPTISLAIHWRDKNPPNEKQYRNLLETALESLIAENPKQALRDLEDVSTAECPDLYPELRWYPHRQWAYHIMGSFGMRMLLNRIDWQQSSPVQELSSDDLPTFMDILQMM